MGGCFNKGKSPTPGPSPAGRGVICFATCKFVLIINSKKSIANSAYRSPPCGGGAGGGAYIIMYTSLSHRHRYQYQ